MINYSEKIDAMLVELQNIPHVANVDDLRDTFDCITVSLKPGYHFKNGMQVDSFQSISQAIKGCDLSQLV